MDGVLIDSKENMRQSWQMVQNKYNLNKIKFDTYFQNIGRPFYDILNIIGVKKNHKEILKIYNNESIKNENLVTFYKDTISTLKKLKKDKISLNIVTSKDKFRTRRFLKNNYSIFSFVNCDNKKIKGKPNPDQIENLIKKLKAKKSECVYIGDTKVDYLTAKNSKIDFIFAEWGYGKKFNYRYKCRKISELYKIIKTI